LADERKYFEIRPGADQFTFQLHRKLKVHGRLLDADAGKPISGGEVLGDLHCEANDGPFGRFAGEWAQAGFAETNDRGEFEIDLAAGRSCVSYSSGRYVSPTRYQIDVPTDGSAVAPDILIKKPPKVRGVVRDKSGKPLAGAVVRFRGSELNNACPSVITDSQGRFELSPPFIPVDWKTEEPKQSQTLVAFHPYEPLGAEAQICWEKSKELDNVVFRMRPQDFGDLVTGYPEELSPWDRGIVPPDEKEHLAQISLVGKPAPELDGAAWLNTEKPKISLADFRGKFVLLQFWTTWCGVCHWDMPRVKLLRDLYGDKGLVVIGVHDNSMPLDTIKEDAAKNGLTYPIVVDQPDGRIVASYRERGFFGFPSFILIGPDGKVIKDDQTVAGPRLFDFKTEIVRQYVMSQKKRD
jgi:thiol-disulfide isomerase/thioredoxin